MALKKCPACGHQISASAKNCPSCGHRQKHFFDGCGTLLFFALLILIVIALFSL